MTSGHSLADMYPPELLSIICSHVYASGVPPETTSLDPFLSSDCQELPKALPSSYPTPHWSESVSRHTLASLCLVNKAFYEAAKPWLWRKVEVRLPRSWLSLVEVIAGGDDEEIEQEQAARLVSQTIQVAEKTTRDVLQSVCGDFGALQLHEKVLETLGGPDGSVPPELLTPYASREPSPRRIRPKSKSPARWKLMRSISDAVRNIMERDHPGFYVPSAEVPHVGRFVQYLDFNHFRTIGMRRSLEEGVNNRFVTGERLESVLKEMPNLLSFGATEYMDGAMTSAILKELLLRGTASGGRGRPSRGRDYAFFDPNDIDEDERERRRECKELEAIDLTGCVSAVFVHALTQFVREYTCVPPQSESDTEGDHERGRSKEPLREPLVFLGLQRLCLRGVRSVQPQVLSSFVLAFPSLTHLDLSCTRATPELLAALGNSPTIRLQSLALERCNWLTGASIKAFLVDAPAARDLRELSLYGDWTFPSALSADDLHEVFARAPCFRSGQLVYLDLSSAPVTRALLMDIAAPQPRLRSLGLSYIRDLELGAVASFLKEKAPAVEVLTLVGTSPQLGTVSARQGPINLHAQIVRPLCTPPFSFSLSSAKKAADPPTRLRVIELSMSLLTSLGAGAEAWRVVKSKGGRGWYVDTASGWIADSSSGTAGSVLRRDLPSGHPWRTALEHLSDANGNVSSGTGWHARKMEVLHGHGLLGREAGLYGAVSFAYQG